MKYKILSIIICVMLLTTFFAVAENFDENDPKKIKEDDLPLNFDDANAPVWEIGDSWTFNLNDVEFAIDDENMSEDFTLVFNLQIGEFTLEVIDDSGDFYTTEILETTVTGDYELVTDINGTILVTGEFEETTLTGSIIFNKSDIGISEFDITIDGRLTVVVEEQPFFEKNVFPKLPVPATITLQIGMDPPLPIIKYPLNSTFYVWGLPEVTVSIGGTIESNWLNIFNFINNAIRKWGLIGLISRFLGTDEAGFQEVSDMINDILPIIDIEYVLSEYVGVNNTFNTPELEYAFFCNNTVDLTVPAGTFYDVYEIEIIGGLGKMYYSPVAENILKMEGNFNEVLPFINNIDLELMSYS